VSLVGYALVPLLVGLLLCFGFAGLFFGVLSAASSGFAALLLGLALDFVIVSYGRYVEERRAGADLAHALQAMAGTSGRAVVTGAVTTAATFYAFSFTEFPGLRQMGLLTGTGILLCMASVLVLLPALLAWSEERHSRRSAEVRTLSLHAFGLGALVSFSLRRPRSVLALAGLVTLAAAALVPRLRFEDDIRKMRPSGSHSLALQNEVASAFGGGFESMMLVSHDSDEDRLIARIRHAHERANALVERGVLGGVDSLAGLLPAHRTQEAALEWLAANSLLLERQRLWEIFSRAAAEEGLRAAAFARGIDLLAAAGRQREALRIHHLMEDPHTRELMRTYVHREGDELAAVVYLRPPAEGWNLVTPPEVIELADALGPELALTGANMLGERLRGQIRTDAAFACLLGFVFVGVLLWAEYRVLADTLLSLLPLGAGMLWMIAGMVMLGIDMNFSNIFVTTMIIGIGVDYGIHMMNRYREHAGDAPAELDASLRETGRAVVLAALSTMVGFGSLSLSHFPGIRSMGLVAILGALSTAVVALTVLPALFGLRHEAAGEHRCASA
jgi:predicted RND superfamily exporter protein